MQLAMDTLSAVEPAWAPHASFSNPDCTVKVASLILRRAGASPHPDSLPSHLYLRCTSSQVVASSLLCRVFGFWFWVLFVLAVLNVVFHGVGLGFVGLCACLVSKFGGLHLWFQGLFVFLFLGCWALGFEFLFVCWSFRLHWGQPAGNSEDPEGYLIKDNHQVVAEDYFLAFLFGLSF